MLPSSSAPNNNQPPIIRHFSPELSFNFFFSSQISAMALGSLSSISLSSVVNGEKITISSPFSSSMLRSSVFSSSLTNGKKRGENGFLTVTMASFKEPYDSPMTGIVFSPFEEVKHDSFVVPVAPHVSLARQRFEDQCENAINEQINVEYNVSYVYHSLYAYFDRDDVALKGIAKFFKESSEEERQHAEKLMEYQNKRGGRVKLYSIQSPLSEFYHAEKGDALYAMELALSLEKLTNEKLLKLHSVAERNNDAQLQDYIEGEFLNEQVEAIKKMSDYVTQLRMVGKGHGVWHFDQMLLHEGN